MREPAAAGAEVEHVNRQRAGGEHMAEEVVIGLASDLPVPGVRIARRNGRQPAVVVRRGRAPSLAVPHETILPDERFEPRAARLRKETPDAAAAIEHAA